MRLKSGLVWPMPITLDVNDDIKQHFTLGKKVALRDNRDDALLAILTGTPGSACASAETRTLDSLVHLRPRQAARGQERLWHGG